MAIFVFILIMFLVLSAGLLLAFLFTRMSNAVTNTQTAMAAEERAYNPGITFGHRIKVDSSYEDQLKEARVQAAKLAAALPRGANNRIGSDGKSTLSTAGKGAANDPLTAVRIARFHGWDGVRTGAPSVNAMAAAGAPVAVAGGVQAAAAAPAIPPPVLITITDGMAPEEIRKARVANAKAQSAYNKALKSAASGAPVAAPAMVAGAVPVVTAAPVAAAPAVSVAAPQLIAITDSMSPEEVRKARVANAKAQSAYHKALKAAGVDPTAATASAAPAAAAPAPAAAAPAVPAAPAAPAAPIGITPPQLIEITDGMSPEEIRHARVANAKAQSAYNKALKAAGIDPASLK